jgi:hypothetical protein
MRLIPYILAVDPNQLEKSFVGIMAATFSKWIQRVKLFGVEAVAFKRNPSVTAVSNQVGSNTTLPENLAYHWAEFSRLALEKLKNDSRNNVSESYEKAEGVERLIIQGRYNLEVLKEWTKEWEQERSVVEHAFLAQGQGGGVTPARLNGTPLQSFDPRDRTRRP